MCIHKAYHEATSPCRVSKVHDCTSAKPADFQPAHHTVRSSVYLKAETDTGFSVLSHLELSHRR